MKKILIFGFVLILLAFSVAAIEPCYQESANVSTACGGLDTGAYNWTSNNPNAYEWSDGDWSSFESIGSSDYYVNYTIPLGTALNQSNFTFQMQDAGSFAHNYTASDNLTDCNVDGLLQIRIRSRLVGLSYHTNVSCMKAGGWYDLYVDVPDIGLSRFWEEGIYWYYYDEYIHNCSPGFVEAAIFNIYDEEDKDQSLNATMEISGEYWISTHPTEKIMFNNSYESNYTHKLCIVNNTQVYGDWYIKYTTENGFTHRYYLINESWNSTAKTYDLYNFNTTTGVSDLKITARIKETYNYFPSVVGKLQKKFLGEGIWLTVQMDRTGDYGQLFYNILEENQDYRLIFVDNESNTLKTTETMKFVCTDALCELTVLLSEYEGMTDTADVTVTWDYSNTTGNISISWVENDAETASVRTLVRKETITGPTIICDTTQAGAAGSYNCNVTAYPGQVFLLITVDGVTEVAEWIDVEAITLADKIQPKEAAFWTFGIMVTTVGFGIGISPVAAVITGIIGLIAVFLLEIFNPITLTFVIIAVLMGLIVGVKVRA